PRQRPSKGIAAWTGRSGGGRRIPHLHESAMASAARDDRAVVGESRGNAVGDALPRPGRDRHAGPAGRLREAGDSARRTGNFQRVTGEESRRKAGADSAKIYLEWGYACRRFDLRGGVLEHELQSGLRLPGRPGGGEKFG